MWRNSDETWISFEMLLVDMDRGDQDPYKGTKYNIIGPLL